MFKTQEEVKEHSGIGVGGVLGFVIYVLLSPVTWFLIPSEVGKMYKADGREAPFSGWTGLWILLPIVGAFVWFIKVQGALNRYWESKAETRSGLGVPAGDRVASAGARRRLVVRPGRQGSRRGGASSRCLGRGAREPAHFRHEAVTHPSRVRR